PARPDSACQNSPPQPTPSLANTARRYHPAAGCQRTGPTPIRSSPARATLTPPASSPGKPATRNCSPTQRPALSRRQLATAPRRGRPRAPDPADARLPPRAADIPQDGPGPQSPPGNSTGPTPGWPILPRRDARHGRAAILITTPPQPYLPADLPADPPGS